MAGRAGRASGHGLRAGGGGRALRVAIACVFLLVSASWAWASEPHRVEVVGVYPIRDALRGKANPRDEAIQTALWEGVSRVALELIGEAVEPDPLEDGAQAPGTGADPTKSSTARFRKVLGREILPYTRSFRILEDRGERPVLFADEPGVRSEYLVVVEVLVDVDRLEAVLARAGLVEGSPAGGPVRQSVTLELIGLERHAGLRRVIDILRRELGATRIETVEFSPARQLIQIEAPFGPDEIASRLSRLEAGDLILDPVEVDREGRRLRILAQWFPAPPAEEQAPQAGGVPGPASRPQ